MFEGDPVHLLTEDTVPRANDIQVDGDHYQHSGVQHWDRLVQLYGKGSFVYFVGCATKYLERYQKKGGIKDLKKARHFVDKLIELEEQWAEPVLLTVHSLPLKEENRDYRRVRVGRDPDDGETTGHTGPVAQQSTVRVSGHAVAERAHRANERTR